MRLTHARLRMRYDLILSLSPDQHDNGVCQVGVGPRYLHRSEELPPVLEKPDDIESLGGSSFVDKLTLFSPPNAVPGLVSCQEGVRGR